jgi:ABC-type transporter Mla subunit MlaD
MKKRAVWIWSGIFLSIFLIIIIAFFFHAVILFHAGKFMAPEGDYEADVAI